jgi:K+-transporting ATPase ATPase A chain
MTSSSIVGLIVFAVVLSLLAWPLGGYLARVFDGTTRAARVLGPVERLLYRAGGVDRDDDMRWTRYAIAVIVFNVAGLVVVYLLQRLQGVLPGNPNHLAAVDPRVAWNTAVSFASNTNWQTYGGETTMSHLVQALALTVQNFVSAATGMAVLVALVRGFTRKHATGIGNFWVDLTRSTLYILLPLSIVLAIALVARGVPQTTDGRVTTALIEARTGDDGAAITTRTWRSARSRRRSRSSSSAPTAAATTTSTRPTRTRTRPRSPTSSSASRSC